MSLVSMGFRKLKIVLQTKGKTLNINQEEIIDFFEKKKTMGRI
jgi:hypothetical protein